MSKLQYENLAVPVTLSTTPSSTSEPSVIEINDAEDSDAQQSSGDETPEEELSMFLPFILPLVTYSLGLQNA
jgi:hypothetical protein